MAAQVKITLKGADRFQKDIRLATGDLADMAGPMSRVASIILSRARQTVPRLTGALGASMIPRSSPVTASVTSNMVYANPIHWGWPRRNIEANPWLSNAGRDTESQWIREIEEHVDNAIERMDKNYT